MHNVPELNRAIEEQLGRVAHSTLLGMANVPAIELSVKLAEIAPPGLKKVFYSDSGATGVEIAFKRAFQYWHNRGVRGKQSFITMKEAYHGDTIGAVSVGSIPLYHDVFRPMLFPSRIVPYPMEECLLILVCSIEGIVYIIRRQRGGDRQIAASKPFTDDHQIRRHPLQIAGEHSAGSAKARRDLVGDQTPIPAIRLAAASLRLMKERRIVEGVSTKAELVASKLAPLAGWPHVGDIRQKGLFIGIELVRDKASKETYDWAERIGVRSSLRARELGMLTRPLGNVVVFIPPLASTEDELDEMTDILASAIRDVTEGSWDG